MRKLVRILVILVIVASGIFGAYAWLTSREAAEDAGFTVVEAKRGSITEKALAVGQIRPRIEFRVKSKISGIVKRCYVDVGDAVEPGDPLFEITPDPTPAELVESERIVEKAEAAYARAKSEHDRTRELVAQGIQAREKLDQTLEAFELARIELERARDTLDLVREGRISRENAKLESIIRAPASGIVLARPVNPGDPVVPLTSFQAGTEMATLADMGDLIFRGTVDEIDVGKMSEGLPARLKIGALPDKPVTGTLTRIAPQAIDQEGARVFEVEIALDPAPGVTLRAGYSATADVIVHEKSEIVTLPERVVRLAETGDEAFVERPPAAPGGEPVEQPIEVGLSDGLTIEVVSGLEEGDAVIERAPRDILG